MAELQSVSNLLSRQRRYAAVRILGSGAFGMVVLAKDTQNDNLVAIKFISAELTQKKYPEREILNHRLLHHPHVIEFRKLFAVPGYLAIVMEYADGCSLFELVKKSKRLNPKLTRWIFQQLIVAVDYCHKKGVSSRDIKCENILLSSGGPYPLVKLCDFGYSHLEDEQGDPQSMVGSSDYMAPEVLDNPDMKKYDAVKSDIWSCGVVLYIMLVGQYPFSPTDKNRSSHQFIEELRVRVCSLKFACPQYVEDGAEHLIKKCLSFAKDRVSIQGIMDDPWFKKDFPADAAHLNDQVMSYDAETMELTERSQSKEEVLRILNKVQSENEAKRETRQQISETWFQKTVTQVIHEHG